MSLRWYNGYVQLTVHSKEGNSHGLFPGSIWHAFGNNGEKLTSSAGIDGAVSKIQDVYFHNI